MSDDDIIQQPDYFPAVQSRLKIQGPAGWLECLSDVAAPELQQPVTAVLCHPHPMHGGSMHNKVVTIMERSLRELGVATLRFNFRGVGESGGEFDNGDGELSDLLALIEWVRTVHPGHDLWLGGFSFGAYVSLRAAQDQPIRQLITIAPPVERFGFAELVAPNCPWLVVQGDEDDVVSPDAVLSWVESLDQRPELVVMEGTGHFFHRRLMDLRGLIKNSVQSSLPRGSSS